MEGPLRMAEELVHGRQQNVHRAAHFLIHSQRVSKRRRGAFVGVCALGADLWVPVSAVVVQDHVDELARRHGSFDGVEEADEPAMAMALHAATEHGAL